MELLFGLSLFVSLCSFLTFQSIAGAAVDPVKVDLNQLKTTEEDLKSPYKGREIATDCPSGAFHHPITGLCIYCDCVGDYSTLSTENKEYYTSNCAHLVNKCLRQFQFYDENLSICRNCSDVCGEDNQNILCKLKCPEDRCCVDTEVYFPHSGSCILCSQICEEERNEAYCIKNCKNYNKSSIQEGYSTVFTTSLNNQSHPSSSTTKAVITDFTDSNSSTIVIVVVITTIAVLLTVAITLFCLKRSNNLRCTPEQQGQGQYRDIPDAGALREENIQMLPIIQQESEIADAPPERRENGNEAAEESPGEKKPVPESGNTGDQVTSQNDSENSLSYRDLHSHDSQRRGQFDDDDVADNDEDDDDDNDDAFRSQPNQSSLATERKLLHFDHSASLS